MGRVTVQQSTMKGAMSVQAAVTEGYGAKRIQIRVSVERNFGEIFIRNAAEQIAAFAEQRFGTDGSNIIYGDGRWKGETEHGACIEIVTRNTVMQDDLYALSEYVNGSHALTAFVTIDETYAVECYSVPVSPLGEYHGETAAQSGANASTA